MVHVGNGYDHGRREGGAFEIISKKGCFHSFEREKKQISPLLAPWKTSKIPQ